MKIGDTRIFPSEGVNKTFQIKDILVDTKITMFWTWTTGVCPHCQKRIEKTTQHELTYIEILEDIATPAQKLEDLYIYSVTTDGKCMKVPIDKFEEILSQSQVYKNFGKGEQNE